MCANHKDIKPSFIKALMFNKCPKCRRGDIFVTKNPYKKGFLKMHEQCPVCGQPTEIEAGFYYGTGYVSYALSVALTVASFIAWWILIGISINDNRIFVWLGFNTLLLIALQPWLMRLSRRIWLGFFVHYQEYWHKDINAPVPVKKVQCEVQ